MSVFFSDTEVHYGGYNDIFCGVTDNGHVAGKLIDSSSSYFLPHVFYLPNENKDGGFEIIVNPSSFKS